MLHPVLISDLHSFFQSTIATLTLSLSEWTLVPQLVLGGSTHRAVPSA